MNIKSFILLLLAFLNISFGLFVYFKNRRSLINIFYLIFITFVGIWSFGQSMFYLISTKQYCVFWSNFIYFSGSSIAVSFFYLARVLSNGKPLRKILIIWPLLSLLILFIFYFFTPLMVVDVIYPNGVKTFEFGHGHLLFDIHFSVLFLLSFTKLLKALKTTSGIKKEQIKYILLSTFIGVVFNGITNISMPSIFHNCSLNWMGPYATFFAVCIMFYAVVQYRIMDINIAIRNVLVYAIEIATISIFLFLLLGAFGFNKFPPMVLSSLGIAVGIIPLRVGISRFVDKLIFKGKYDYQQSLAEITNVLPTIIEQDKLIKYTIDNITKNMLIKRAIIFLKDEFRNIYIEQYSVGLNVIAPDRAIDGACGLIKWLKEHKDVLLRHELHQVVSTDVAEEILSVVNPFDAELIIPFKKSEDLVGFFCLSHKGGGGIFNHSDLRILQTLATQIVMSLENINLYRKIEHSQRIASIGIMASSLVHEIKNPLAPIKTYIQNLRNNINNPQYIDKVTKIIPEEVDKITDIINRLRDFANPPPLSISKVNIHNLINKRLGLLEQDLELRNILVEKHYSPALSEINADPIQLERVFLNLFLNALDAMPNGGKLTIITEITPDNMALIKVSDTGVGIEKEDLQHIFDPFFSKGKQHGSGLGLAITHRIIKEHGGTIHVESTIFKGTTFFIHLPIRD